MCRSSLSLSLSLSFQEDKYEENANLHIGFWKYSWVYKTLHYLWKDLIWPFAKHAITIVLFGRGTRGDWKDAESGYGLKEYKILNNFFYYVKQLELSGEKGSNSQTWNHNIIKMEGKMQIMKQEIVAHP